MRRVAFTAACAACAIHAVILGLSLFRMPPSEVAPVVVSRWTRPSTGRASRRRTPRAEPQSKAAVEGAAEGNRGGSPGPIQSSLRDVVGWGNIPPSYPLDALENGWQGTVELEIQWAEGGEAERVDVVRSSGFPSLDESARRAAARWQAPAAFGGRRLRVPIAYELESG